MSWPQVVIASCMLVNLCATISRTARDRKLSSGLATGVMFISAAVSVAYALVLHVGGFW